MFQKVFLFSKLPLLVSTWAVIALCFTASQLQAFPTSTNNPPAPPGTLPTGSSTLDNVTSTWRFSCTEPGLKWGEGGRVFCEIDFYQGTVAPDTIEIRGTVLGGEVAGSGFIEDRRAIWEVDIDIVDVEREFGDPVFGPGPGEGLYCQQTVIYKANLANDARVVGSYTLLPFDTRDVFGQDYVPFQNPDDPFPYGDDNGSSPWRIDVGAEKGVTNCLFTGDEFSDICDITNAPETLTFPGGKILGQTVDDNQVLRYQQIEFLPSFFCSGENGDGPVVLASYNYDYSLPDPVPGPYLIARYCHDADLGTFADVTCLREEGGVILSTTGDFDSLTLAKPAVCNDGPLAGTVQVGTGFSEVTLVSTDLDCMAGTNSEASGRFPFAGADPVPVVQALAISAGSTVVSRIVTGFGVNTDPNDLSFRNLVLRRFIDGDEELRFRLDPPLGNEPVNRFIAVSADYFVGWKKTQNVVITGKLNGQVVDTQTIIAESLPGKLKSARIDTVFSAPVDEIVFSTGPGNHGGRSIYGLRNPTFATAVVEAQP